MPRSKEIQEQVRNKIVDMYQSGKGYKARTTSKELQASLASIKVSVHDSTIRKRLGKNGKHGRVQRQKPLLTKKNTKAYLTFAKKYLDKDIWANILWTDETKVELFGRCVSHYICHKTNTAFHKKNIIPTVRHGGGSVMVWDFRTWTTYHN